MRLCGRRFADWNRRRWSPNNPRLVDPDNFQEAVLDGLRSIERREGTEIRTREELRRYFEDIIARGKKRLVAKSKAARG